MKAIFEMSPNAVKLLSVIKNIRIKKTNSVPMPVMLASIFLVLAILFDTFLSFDVYIRAAHLLYFIPIGLITWSASLLHARVFVCCLIVFSCISFWFCSSDEIACNLPLATHSINELIAILAIFIGLHVGFIRLKRMILAISLDAESDGLTQLFNHKGFHRRLVEESRRLNRYKRPFSLVYIDLDNFKSVNDQLGHTTGDRLLETVARTIKANTRPTDHSARLGGDEFAILMTETDESQVVTPVEKLFKELITEMNNHDWPVTFSVGVLTWKEDVSNINDIISEADTVMYRVKRTTKNSIAFQTHIAGNPLVEVAAVDTRSVVKP